MRSNTAVALIFMLIWCCCGVVHTNAQTTASQDVSQLENEIQRRELVDRDDSILSEDKATNRVKLETARTKLRTLLQTQIDSKRKVRATLGETMEAQEAQEMDAAIQSLEAKLRQLGKPIDTSSAANTVSAPVSAPPNTNNPIPSDTNNNSAPTPGAIALTTTTSATSPAPVPITSPASGDVLPIRACSVVNQNTAAASNLEKFFCGRVADIDRRKKANTVQGLRLNRDFFFVMITLLAREGRAQYVVEAENERVDKQVGSDVSSSGSTSLVSKGSVPSILGFAVDTGALLKSTNGSTLTFRGNVAGLAKALAGQGFISGYDDDSAAARFLRRTSFSFSFDPTRDSPDAPFTGSKQQFSNGSFRIDLYNQRDARAPRYTRDWNAFLSNQSEALSAQIFTSLTHLTDPAANTWHDPALQNWFVLADAAIRGASGMDEIDAVLRAQLNNIPKDLDAATLDELRSFSETFKAWLDERERILDKVAKAPIVTFEYIYDSPVNARSLSKFNFIGEGGFGPRLDLTFNGSFSIFNKKSDLASEGRLRDFSFATQLDVPFGEMGLGMGKPVLSFAGRYERLMSNAIDARKGDVGIGQLKFTIPIKNSGIRIPLSFSFANRTELIKEKEVRGNFGFTFDPDVLFALFNPFSRK
ncbi:MAG TPA: hypothetical protein VJ784_11425 [Pyrinomonadaceae bacterium]|nr:hypothetical protein [Pyrinomonadaceae bacterium]